MSGNGSYDNDVDERRARLKRDFEERRGYWSPFWDGLLLDLDFFEAYLNFSSVPWKEGPLEPKVKEFIYIAIDASTTHLYEPGLTHPECPEVRGDARGDHGGLRAGERIGDAHLHDKRSRIARRAGSRRKTGRMNGGLAGVVASPG